jgi:hypothetical protein
MHTETGYSFHLGDSIYKVTGGEGKKGPRTIITNKSCLNTNKKEELSCLIISVMISRKTENSLHELIIVDLNPSITISIQPSKGLAKLLDNDTGTNKSVKRDSRWRTASTTRCRGFDIYPERGHN